MRTTRSQTLRRQRISLPSSILAVLLVLLLIVPTLAQVFPGATERVSVASDGSQADGPSEVPALSAGGRFVAFYSNASNLVPGDTNFEADVFVHDRQRHGTTRVSVASNGAEGNLSAGIPAISADGRFVTFYSDATNLVPGDTNDSSDVFVHDRQTAQTSRVSVASDGTQGNFTSQCGPSAISADGRFVTFYSDATNLVPGDTNGTLDVFVHDRQTGQTTRVSVATDGTQADNFSGLPAMSADGRFVAFGSFASNLVAGDTNGASDLFVHDRQTGQTTRASVATGGAQGNGDSPPEWPAISADGRFVAFISFASNLVPSDTNDVQDIFVHDRQMGRTTRASVSSRGAQGNSGCGGPSMSADGRFVAFVSFASNLVAGDTNGALDVFVHDRQTGRTTWVSAQGNADSGGTAMSADGHFVAFTSWASNLVGRDTNALPDIFVRGVDDDD